jgi:hypothetical protein
MAELLTLLFIVLVSMVIVRVGAVALSKTGLSMDISRFQAQSAYMGVGFTTKESETIMEHPLRRRIVRILMMVGSAGISTTIVTLVITFTQNKSEGPSFVLQLAYTVLGLAVIILLWRLKPVDRVVSRWVHYLLSKSTALDIHDYEELLKTQNGYAVAQVLVEDDGWLAGLSLREANLTAEGLVILNITRSGGSVLGTPTSRTHIQPGDRLLCYGRDEDLAGLCHRSQGREGDEAHARALRRQYLRQEEERALDLQAELPFPGP